MSINDIAEPNFEALRKNSYPGRGIIIGMDQAGTSMIQVYWIMGRSSNSQNRRFCSDGGRVFTDPVDPATIQDMNLVIYNAMRENTLDYVVSNGDQTDDIASSLNLDATASLADIAERHDHEPDAPNYTSRISGICSRLTLPAFQLSIIRKSDSSEGSDRQLFQYEGMPLGFGRCITTYSGDGNPLPPFRGEPLLVPLSGSHEDIIQAYWNALNPEFRVSLAVKSISLLKDGSSKLRIINRFPEVPSPAQA